MQELLLICLPEMYAKDEKQRGAFAVAAVSSDSSGKNMFY